jgi:predicted secreted protein
MGLRHFDTLAISRKPQQLLPPAPPGMVDVPPGMVGVPPGMGDVPPGMAGLRAFCLSACIAAATAASLLIAQPSAAAQQDTAKSPAAEDAAEDTAEGAANSDAATGETDRKPNDADIYPATFFDQYAPQNALEMIQRLPGFSFRQGSNVRGFGGSAGNVLIDGSRPTSKSGGLRAALLRIPSAQVERIEIFRGGISSGDAAGQSIVANVIRKKGGTSGRWAYKTRRAPDGRLRPNLEFAIATQLGAWDASFDLDIGANAQNREATVSNFDAAGLLLKSSDEIQVSGPKWLVVSGEGSRPFASGKLTLNGRVSSSKFTSQTTREGFDGRLPDASANDDFWQLADVNRSRQAELSLDWARTYSNSWKMHLIGLGSVNSNKFSNQFMFEDFASDSQITSSFAQDSTKTEFILRSTYGLTKGKFKPEFGVEVTRNRLDSALEFFQNGTEINLDSANVKVTELRGEAFATAIYQFSKKLTLDGGLTFEASEISVAGDATNKQTLSFLKPRISATYVFNKKAQLTLEAERRVGQLDFNRFAASNNTQDDRSTGGNPDLVPDTRTVVAATLDWKFAKRGSIKARAFYQWRKDILEEIVLPSGSVGSGNAGSARFYGFVLEGNIPLDKVLKGGLLQAKYVHRRSIFSDPILGGDTRRISRYTPSSLSFEFRQDITSAKLAWGVTYQGSFTNTTFLVDQIIQFSGNKRLLFFAETTRYLGLKFRLEMGQANTGRFNRNRFFFDGDRNGAPDGSEIASRSQRPEFKFDISGSF